MGIPLKQISMSPYPTKLWVASSRKDYEKGHVKLFRRPDILTCNQGGRFSGGEGRDGIWTHLVWAKSPAFLAHEIAHVILHTFEIVGIDPREAGGEPFCYMLSSILTDIKKK
jgi:hypothetical protein